MTQPVMYGQLQSEKLAEESRLARDILKEINNFGINERQRWLLMYGLALELENVEDLKALTGFIKARRGHDVFLTGTIKEEDDGSIGQ